MNLFLIMQKNEPEILIEIGTEEKWWYGTYESLDQLLKK